MTKKLVLLFSLSCSLVMTAQKKKKDIVYSTNIAEIENFLKTAHPEDPRRSVLKPKLIALKNSAWMKPGQNSLANLKPTIVEIPKSVMKQRENAEAEEFRKLLSESPEKHQQKTVNLLNQLFDNDITNKEAILLMKNNSDCNMIVRIQGKQFYNLAVPARGENFLVVEKGSYQINSNVCDAKYNAAKSIEKNMLIAVTRSVSKSQKLASIDKN